MMNRMPDDATDVPDTPPPSQWNPLLLLLKDTLRVLPGWFEERVEIDERMLAYGIHDGNSDLSRRRHFVQRYSVHELTARDGVFEVMATRFAAEVLAFEEKTRMR